jgi:hypothetical protein
MERNNNNNIIIIIIIRSYYHHRKILFFFQSRSIFYPSKLLSLFLSGVLDRPITTQYDTASESWQGGIGAHAVLPDAFSREFLSETVV